jgi:hypothetical protein
VQNVTDYRREGDDNVEMQPFGTPDVHTFPVEIDREPRRAVIRITFSSDFGEDLDLYVEDPNGEDAGSSTQGWPTEEEIVEIDEERLRTGGSGSWVFRVECWSDGTPWNGVDYHWSVYIDYTAGED